MFSPLFFKQKVMNKYYFLIFLILSIIIKAQGNFVQINGKTNINSFKCANDSFHFSAGVLQENSLPPNINLKVSEFDCGNRIITKDFQKTLEADKFPVMSIRFLGLTKTQNSYTAVVEVKMMNHSKKYNIEFDLEKNKLLGKRKVKFSDFDIEPPRRMGGMIVVKDDLDLAFSLAVQN